MRPYLAALAMLAAMPLFSTMQAASAPVPAASPAAAATALPSPGPTAYPDRARTELDAWIGGKIDRSHYSAEAGAQLTDAIVAQVAAMLAPGGKVTSFAYAGPEKFRGQIPVQTYSFTFEKPLKTQMGTAKDFVESIAFDKDGKVTFIFFSPKQTY